MDLRGSGTRMSAARCHLVAACGSGLDPPNIKISDSGGLDLEAWCLDAWMLEGLKWIGGGDGGDGILGRGDWKKFPHARASGARRIYCLRGHHLSAATDHPKQNHIQHKKKFSHTQACRFWRPESGRLVPGCLDAGRIGMDWRR